MTALFEAYLKQGLSPGEAAKKLHRSLALLKKNTAINTLVRTWYAENEVAVEIGRARLVEILVTGTPKEATEAFKALRDPATNPTVAVQVNQVNNDKSKEREQEIPNLPFIDIWNEKEKE